MGRNLDDFFDGIMRHKRAGYEFSKREFPSEGFAVDSKGQATAVPAQGTIKELLDHHDQGFHEYSSGKNPIDIQFSRRYCPKCQEGNNA